MAKIVGFLNLEETNWGIERAARERAARTLSRERARAARERAARAPLLSRADADRLKSGLKARPWQDCV